MSRWIVGVFAGWCAFACAGATPLSTVRVASGLTRPVAVAHAPGDPQRLYVCEQTGKVRVVLNGVLQSTPFLDITPLVGLTLEWGLLNIVFDPDFQSNRYFYIYYSEITTGKSIIARYTATTADVADPASAAQILKITFSGSNHRGSFMQFGQDGYLYISTGDGTENDTAGNGQNLNTLQAKILRIDPNGPDDVYLTPDDDEFPADPLKNYAIPPTNPFVGVTGEDEIWAYGLRNPWRCSFDRLTGELYIGDVGQVTREEISYQPANNSPLLGPGMPGYMGGRNYGWRCREGTFCFDSTCCGNTGFIDPVFEYPRSSVTGGVVYRGCAIPDLRGTYWFADWGGIQRSFRLVNGVVTDLQNRRPEVDPTNQIGTPVHFGEDYFGEILIVDWQLNGAGEIWKIVPATFVGPDCNVNLVNDDCEIVANPALDSNHNGVLDSCEPPPMCPGDANGDFFVDAADLSVLLSNFGSPGAGPGTGDFNADGQCDGADLSVLLGAFGSGC